MTPDAFWEFQRAGWDRAAAYYDEYWTDTRLFVEPLIDAAGVRAGSRVLDVACGPGYVSEAAASRGADAVGVDVAPAMVQHARTRCPVLTFLEGDAQRLAFEDAGFDAVTMNFGILHLSQPATALAEACRVLRSGGRLAFTAWVEEGNAEAQIVDAAIQAHALPVELPEGPSYYGFADHDAAARVLGETGFDADSLRMETVTVPWRVPTVELLFDAQVKAGVRVGAVLRAQPPERLRAIREAMAEGVARYADGDGFTLPIVARVISAQPRD